MDYEIVDEMLDSKRGLSLTLAVLYHGLSCNAEKSVPAKADTVVNTAKLFESHLNAG